MMPKIHLCLAFLLLILQAVSGKQGECKFEDVERIIEFSQQSYKMIYGKYICDYSHREHIDFFMVGDIGGSEELSNEGMENERSVYAPTPGQLAVAMNMRNLVEKNHVEHKKESQGAHSSAPFTPDFVLNLGDNFYEHGLNSEQKEDHFKKIFLDVYISSPSHKTSEASQHQSVNPLAVNWFSVLGNNDWKMLAKQRNKTMKKLKNEWNHLNPSEKQKYLSQGEADKEMPKAFMDKGIFEVLHKKALMQIRKPHPKNKDDIGLHHPDHKEDSKKWNLPSEFYVMEFDIKGKGNGHGKVVFVAIDTVLLCGASRKDFKNNPIKEKTLEMEKHFIWLEKTLEHYNKNGNILFVAGHYPVYVGGQAVRAFLCVDRLQQIFNKNKVTAYLAGHEHTLKYVHKEGQTPQIISGAASRMENCWHPNHVYDMGKEIKFCYPDGIAFAQHKINQEVRQGKVIKIDKEKNKEGVDAIDNKKDKGIKEGSAKTKEEEKNEDSPTIYDGGAFVTVRVSAMDAEFNFYAAGGNIYPKTEDAHKPEDYPENLFPGWKAHHSDMKEQVSNGLKIEHLDKVVLPARK